MTDDNSSGDQDSEQTKRQKRLEKVSNPGADDKEKGIVWRADDGTLYWVDEKGNDVQAVYHNDIRAKLLARASNHGRNVYDHPRKAGRARHDETAFLESQRHWSPDKQQWHKIKDDVLNRYEQRDYKCPDYKIESMYDDGRIVLDPDNHPVRDFHDLPLVHSSEFEGWNMEAISRIDTRIERTDFRARMPHHIELAGRRTKKLVELSAIGNRRMRFRKQHGLVSWTARSGSKAYADYVKSKLSAEDFSNNTTQNLEGLTKEEQVQAGTPNKGAFLSRAGTRRLTEEERQARENRQEKVKKRRSKKRPAEEDIDDHENKDRQERARRLSTIPAEQHPSQTHAAHMDPPPVRYGRAGQSISQQRMAMPMYPAQSAMNPMGGYQAHTGESYTAAGPLRSQDPQTSALFNNDVFTIPADSQAFDEPRLRHFYQPSNLATNTSPRLQGSLDPMYRQSNHQQLVYGNQYIDPATYDNNVKEPYYMNNDRDVDPYDSGLQNDIRLTPRDLANFHDPLPNTAPMDMRLLPPENMMQHPQQVNYDPSVYAPRRGSQAMQAPYDPDMLNAMFPRRSQLYPRPVMPMPSPTMTSGREDLTASSTRKRRRDTEVADDAWDSDYQEAMAQRRRMANVQFKRTRDGLQAGPAPQPYPSKTPRKRTFQEENGDVTQSAKRQHTEQQPPNALSSPAEDSEQVTPEEEEGELTAEDTALTTPTPNAHLYMPAYNQQQQMFGGVLQAPIDYRFEKPRTEQEAQYIQSALNFTREHYSATLMTNDLPQLTPRQETYAYQYALMQRELIASWPLNNARPPCLEHLDVWTGGFDKWTRIFVNDDEFVRELWDDEEEEPEEESEEEDKENYPPGIGGAGGVIRLVDSTRPEDVRDGEKGQKDQNWSKNDESKGRQWRKSKESATSNEEHTIEKQGNSTAKPEQQKPRDQGRNGEGRRTKNQGQ